MIESWMVTIVIFLVGIIAVAAVYKYKTDANQRSNKEVHSSLREADEKLAQSIKENTSTLLQAIKDLSEKTHRESEKINGELKAENLRLRSELEALKEVLFRRLDKHGDDIVRLNTQAELAMTSDDADGKYVSKELFRQFEGHMNSRFDDIKEGQGKILSFLQNSIHKDNTCLGQK